MAHGRFTTLSSFCASVVLLSLLTGGCTNTESTSALQASGSDYSTVSGGASEKEYGDLKIVPSLPSPPDTNNGQNELVAENDLLEVDVFQVDELDKTVRVNPNGSIALPLIGELQAKGKTIPQLESDIEASYRTKYLQNPEVSVFMKESAGQKVTVDGAVNKPGIYSVSSTTTLLQVIALAGGFKEVADETKLYVYRDISGKKLVANFSVKDIRGGKKSDPRIYGGDVVVSFDSDAKVAAKNLREALGMASNAVGIVF